MAEFIELTAADGHKLAAWRAVPLGEARGGVVVIQEIFGVNSHIRDVTERFSEQGYLAIAPALFDRYERGFETGYQPDDMVRARALMTALDWDKAVLDVDAARGAAAAAGKVGTVGYCWGGSVSWLAACRLQIGAAVAYYGGQIERFKQERPHCPVLMHFGKRDDHIPLATVEAIRAAQPEVPIHLYDAGHGFNSDRRADYSADCARLARLRTLQLFQRSSGVRSEH